MNIHTTEDGWVYITNDSPSRLDYGMFLQLVNYLKSTYPHQLARYYDQPIYAYKTIKESMELSIKSFLGESNEN